MQQDNGTSFCLVQQREQGYFGGELVCRIPVMESNLIKLGGVSHSVNQPQCPFGEDPRGRPVIPAAGITAHDEFILLFPVAQIIVDRLQRICHEIHCVGVAPGMVAHLVAFAHHPSDRRRIRLQVETGEIAGPSFDGLHTE